MRHQPCLDPSCPDVGKYCRRPGHTTKPTKAELEQSGSKNDLPRLEREATESFNAYIRFRDRGKTCICGCGRKIEQAGHCFPAGSYSGVKFDEVNVNGIAKVCNYYKNTSAIDPEYQAGLVVKIGAVAFKKLEKRANETRLYRWTRTEYVEVKETYDQKLKGLKSKKL